jgi:hypothetical protein
MALVTLQSEIPHVVSLGTVSDDVTSRIPHAVASAPLLLGFLTKSLSLAVTHVGRPYIKAFALRD